MVMSDDRSKRIEPEQLGGGFRSIDFDSIAFGHRAHLSIAHPRHQSTEARDRIVVRVVCVCVLVGFQRLPRLNFWRARRVRMRYVAGWLPRAMCIIQERR